MNGKVALFVFLALVAVSFSERKSCCVPDQYEAISGRTFGGVRGDVTHLVKIDELIAFDYTNRRSAEIMVTIIEGKRYKVGSISDYKNGMQYYYEVATKKCSNTEILGPMSHCLPDNAVYDSTLYIGDRRVMENVYSFSVNTYPYVGNVTMAVTADECIPIGRIFTGSVDGEPSLETYMEANYTKGIRNPDMFFTVPDYCPKNSKGDKSGRFPIRMTPF